MQARSKKDGILRAVEHEPKKKSKSIRGGSVGYAVLREGEEWGVFILTIGGTDNDRGLKLLSTWATEPLAEKEAARLMAS